MIRSSDDRHQRLEFLPSRQVPKARATAALAALLFYRVQSSNPRSVPRNEPAHKAPPPSSPALGYYAKGLPAAVVLLRRNRTHRPLQSGIFAPALTRAACLSDNSRFMLGGLGHTQSARLRVIVPYI